MTAAGASGAVPDRLRALDGVDIVESRFVPGPRPPTPGEDGVRIVRHGLREVLEWLGEEVGPAPGEPVHTIFVFSDAVNVWDFNPVAFPVAEWPRKSGWMEDLYRFHPILGPESFVLGSFTV